VGFEPVLTVVPVPQKSLVIATIAADLAVTDLTMPREDGF